MNAPNRSVEVADIINAIGPKPETESDEGRRGNTFEVVRRLNVIDGGFWGVLLKTDEGNKVPADVIVWRPTMEHFDIQKGGSGAPTWGPIGVVKNTAWLWQEVEGYPAPIPTPTPIPVPSPSPAPDDDTPLDALRAVLRDELAPFRSQLDELKKVLDQLLVLLRDGRIKVRPW